MVANGNNWGAMPYGGAGYSQNQNLPLAMTGVPGYPPGSSMLSFMDSLNQQVKAVTAGLPNTSSSLRTRGYDQFTPTGGQMPGTGSAEMQIRTVSDLQMAIQQDPRLQAALQKNPALLQQWESRILNFQSGIALRQQVTQQQQKPS